MSAGPIHGASQNVRADRGAGRAGLVAALPASGAFLLPIGACPACWPAYTAFLGWLGLGFLLSGRYLLPIAAILLGLTLAMLAYRARARRGYGPFFLGIAGAAGAIAGKFVFSIDLILYLGLVLILAAAVWNVWPRPRAASCPTCTPSRLLPQKEPSR